MNKASRNCIIVGIICGFSIIQVFRSMNGIHDFSDNLPQSSLSIEKIGQFDDGGTTRGVFVDGDLAYVADFEDGLEIVNISNPTWPLEIGELNYGGHPYRGIEVIGDRAYVADYTNDDNGSLLIIDVLDPANPFIVGRYDNLTTVVNFDIEGNYAYVASFFYGLHIVDITNPSSPCMVGHYSGRGDRVWDVKVIGDYAYVANGEDGMGILDISDPTSPKELGWVNQDGTGSAKSIFFHEGNAYVGDWTDGMEIIDISNSTNPYEVGQYSDGGKVERIHVAEKYAYVGRNTGGIDIVDISDPTNPIFVNNSNDGGTIHDLFYSDGYVYTADLVDGLEIHNIYTGTSFFSEKPSDVILECHGYQNYLVSWTVIDIHPDIYSITLLGTGIVVNPTPWSSGTCITYLIPSDLEVGIYTFQINVTNDAGISAFDSVIVTIRDTTAPILSRKPDDIILGYTNSDQTISWTAEDPNPGTYTIYQYTLTGFWTVVYNVTWESEIPIVYTLPDTLKPTQNYRYEVKIRDKYGNSVSDSVSVEGALKTAVHGYSIPLVLVVGALAIGIVIKHNKKKNQTRRKIK